MMLLALLLSIVYAGDIKCRGLALSGGGSKGAYEAGAFEALVKALPEIEVNYDIITGVSAGSMNAGAIGLFPRGSEAAANDFLQSFWFNITSSQVYEIKWPIVYNLLYGNSLVDDTPLQKTLGGYAHEYGMHRPVIVGTTNFDTAEFTNFSTETCDLDCMLRAIISSSSIPAVFQPQYWRNTTFVDGGVINNIDIPSAIQYCLDKGFDQEDIIIDAAFCSDGDLPSVDNFEHVYDIYSRVQDIQGYDSDFHFIGQTMQYFPDVHYRYVMIPSEAMSGNSLDFDHDLLQGRIALGRNDTLTLINKFGPGGNGGQFYQDWRVKFNR